MIKSFRLRITAWYAVFFSVLLAVFSLFLYQGLARSLQSRLDETLLAEVRTAAALFSSEMREMNGNAAAAAAEAVEEMQTGGVFIAIILDGKVLAGADPGGAAAIPGNVSGEFLFPAPGGSYGFRAAVRSLTVSGQSFRISAASSLEPMAAELAGFRRLLWSALAVFLAIGACGGFLLAGYSVRPVTRMAGQARAITARSLHKRLEAGRSTEELSALAGAFNQLLARLDASFETMSRFIADASHEMRTPLAIIRGEADVALTQPRSAVEYRASLAAILEESKRLGCLVDDLLNLARADAGSARLDVRDLYLNDLLADCCRSVQPAAAAKSLRLECRAGEDLACRGDERLLRRLVLNLLDNAIRYTPEGGRVEARLAAGDASVRIEIADSGIGIPPEAAPHLFERFYRADAARSRQDGGFGLGLAIVQWIADSHHGRVEVASCPGAGSTFTVTLPAGGPV